jgi:hypothetical protein
VILSLSLLQQNNNRYELYQYSQNVCEICGQKATAGILDNEDTNHNDRDIQIRIRYSCLDHYLQIYQKVQGERKKRNEFSKH